jgi:hypothetical protein
MDDWGQPTHACSGPSLSQRFRPDGDTEALVYRLLCVSAARQEVLAKQAHVAEWTVLKDSKRDPNATASDKDAGMGGSREGVSAPSVAASGLSGIVSSRQCLTERKRSSPQWLQPRLCLRAASKCALPLAIHIHSARGAG